MASGGGDTYQWYEKYFEVLTNIGLVPQQHGFATYRESSEDFAAHEGEH